MAQRWQRHARCTRGTRGTRRAGKRRPRHFVDSCSLLRTHVLTVLCSFLLISLRFVAFGLIMEYFIEKVKLHPCLWKMNDISYRDIGKKNLIWARIAKECEMANGE